MTDHRVHSLFNWLGHSAVGEAMRASLLSVPFAVIVHLLGLALLGGSTLIVTLSVWGVILRRPATSRVATELWPFAVTGLVLTILTGVLLISANSNYYFDSPVFWVKLALLIPSVTVSLLLHRHLRKAADHPLPLRWKFTGGLNLLLWTSVAVAGRAIGLL